MVDAVAVSDQSVGHAAEIEQTIPVGIIASQTGDFEAEHDSHVTQSNLCSHAREPGTLDGSRAGQAKVFVNDDHLFLGPTEFKRFLDQSILTCGGLAVVLDLRRGGLANVDESSALGMTGLYFGQIIHDFPPGCGCLRLRWR